MLHVLVFFGVTFARIRNFRLDINNNLEPRYYINDLVTSRIPTDIQENKREYRLTAEIAMEDSLAWGSSDVRSLWKELILEGNYQGTGTPALAGFDISLTFTRGASDTITITSPSNTASSAFEDQGCFFVRAGEILMRNMSVVVVDSVGVYP